MAELREKYILDRNTEIRNAEAKGRQEGRLEAIQAGKKEERNLEKAEIAKKMKQKGMDIQTIMELTELGKEEIEKL